MGALTTIVTAIVDIAHLVRVAAVKHLLHHTIIIAGIVARRDLFEAVSVIGEDLLEDAPIPSRLENHQSAPSERVRVVRMLRVKRLYHDLPSPSTPHRPPPRLVHLPR
jgi:hypothetical protein